MMEQLTFDKENYERIRTVERSFGPTRRSLSKPGRFLMGQGYLMKQGRRKPQPKVFFLFNDVLVYGSIILSGRLHIKKKMIPLENIQLEDMEDNFELRNQWLIHTPRKSFFVAADSYAEKRAWIEHIEDCQSNLLQSGSRLGSTFAVPWIPDRSAQKCMRCFSNFTATKRRHHCRKCGFLVCKSCSKKRMLIEHIHPTHKVKVCSICHTRNKEDEMVRRRGGSAGKDSLEEEDMASSDEELCSNQLAATLVKTNRTTLTAPTH